MLLGCCTAAIAFLAKIGSLDRVRFHSEIDLVDVEGRRLAISASRLPAPFHLAPSILRAGYFTGAQRLALAKGFARVALSRPRKDENAAEYLCRTIGDAQVIDRLIAPVLVSALNEEPERASASCAQMVIVESLLRSRRGYRLGVPSAPLSEIVAVPAANYLRSRGCDIRFAARVAGVDARYGLVRSLELTSGQRDEFDGCALAVPPWSLRLMGLSDQGTALTWNPIVSAQMTLDAHPQGSQQVCLAGEPFGWVFDKSDLAPDGRGRVQAVASAAGGIVDQPEPVLTELALRAVRRAWPGMARARLERIVFCRTRRATFSTGGESDGLRPGAKTPLGNLFLAGDWTDTGWPATIESAVRSGTTAAKRLLEVLP